MDLKPRLIACISSVLFLVLLSSCGYHMRGQDRPFFKLHNINTLYVTPVHNNSYKAGVEITVYNALRKRFSQGGYIRIVNNPEQADAKIEATVMTAEYAPLTSTTADKIASVGSAPGPGSVLIASTYQVSLAVKFALTDSRQKSLWGDLVGRSKSFAASNYMGTLGDTSALINEGEFERTLSDLSVSIATDAEESINTIN